MQALECNYVSHLANIWAPGNIFDENIFLDAAVIWRIPLPNVNIWVQDWNPSLPLGSDSVQEVLQNQFPISNMKVKKTCWALQVCILLFYHTFISGRENVLPRVKSWSWSMYCESDTKVSKGMLAFP